MKDKTVFIGVIISVVCSFLIALLVSTCYANVAEVEENSIHVVEEIQDSPEQESEELLIDHGYDELSNEIYVMEELYQELEVRLIYQEYCEPTHTTLYYETNNPFDRTCLNAEKLDAMLIDTELHGYGDTFAKMEEDYGVNAVYAISVMCLESGYGKYPLPGYNYFGLSSCKFSDIESCIMYFGELLSSDLYYGRDLYGIASIYCPVNPKYVPDIQWIMNSRWELLEASQ